MSGTDAESATEKLASRGRESTEDPLNMRIWPK